MNDNKLKGVLGLIALSLVMFIVTLDTTITNIALPTITNFFHTNLSTTNWISTVYVLVLSVFIIPASKLADQFGRKKVMLIGLVAFGTGSALCGTSQTIHILILMRILQGIGGAIITPIMIPLSVEAFGREKAGQAVGIIGAVTAIAAAAGPPIGGIIIEFMNWQFIFFVNVPVVLITLILIILCFQESYDNTISKQIDWFGMIFLSIGLFQLTFVLIKGYSFGWTSIPIILLSTGSLVSLVIFAVVESKMKEPLIEFSLFHEITFAASTIGYFLCGFAIVCSSLIFNYFLQNVRGYTALHSAYIIMTMSITVIFSMPLGSILAKKIGYRPIIFPGILLMSISMFFLYRLNYNTSSLIMIGDMIILGFGFGLTCQSLVSACNFIPQSKAGIASGIVNAARQIGTCLGIALLVGMMTHNVDIAKNTIESSTLTTISNANISPTVKDIMVRDIRNSFQKNKDNDNANKSDLQKTLKKDIAATLKHDSSSPIPQSNSTLKKLYDGTKSLSDGISETHSGLTDLNNGLNSLSSGYDELLDGDTNLNSGLSSLDSGLNKTLSGSQKLNTSSKEGINTLTSSIQSINNGASELYSQFSHSDASNNPTIYDAITGVSSGTQKLSDNLEKYYNAVNNTYYLMIKNDPASTQLLETYKTNLAQVQQAYSTSNEADKAQYALQIQALSNLVTLYTAGTDSSVTSEEQFEDTLIHLANQDNSNPNTVSIGKQIVDGANKLEVSSTQIAAQFTDSGSFKNGMMQLVNGTSKLAQSNDSLNSLQVSISDLTNALSNLKTGSHELLDGSQNLQEGIINAKTATNDLKNGSARLVNASSSLEDGSTKLSSGIELAEEVDEIQTITDQLRADKNNLITKAFNKVFLMAAIILLIFSISGLFTDKSAMEYNKKNKSSS